MLTKITAEFQDWDRGGKINGMEIKTGNEQVSLAGVQLR
jgi:hypothetical protein